MEKIINLVFSGILALCFGLSGVVMIRYGCNDRNILEICIGIVSLTFCLLFSTMTIYIIKNNKD